MYRTSAIPHRHVTSMIYKSHYATNVTYLLRHYLFSTYFSTHYLSTHYLFSNHYLFSTGYMAPKYSKPPASLTDPDEFPPLSLAAARPPRNASRGGASPWKPAKQPHTKPSTGAVASDSLITSQEVRTMSPMVDAPSESLLTQQPPDTTVSSGSSMDAPASSECLPPTQPPPTRSSMDTATPGAATLDTATPDTADPVISDAANSDAANAAASGFPPLSLQKSPTTSSTNTTASSNPLPLVSKPASYAAISKPPSYAAISTNKSSDKSSDKSSVRVQPGSALSSSNAQEPGAQPGAQPLTMSSTHARHKRDRPLSDAQDHESVQAQGDIKLSKAMSWLLRHGAKEEGIEIGEDGLVRVNDLVGGGGGRRGERTVVIMEKLLLLWRRDLLVSQRLFIAQLSHPRFKRYKFEDVRREVNNNDKQRYTLVQREVEGGNKEWLIRANQGHSLKVDAVEMTQIKSADEIPVAIHGTYTDNWLSIEKTGLSKMNRNHIHFAAGMLGEDGVISDGIVFYRSTNNVILTEGQNGMLEAKYFKKVVDQNGKEIFKASG
ncbi:hypothetical protein BC937DRAFT_89101 [Endogone sp. FLAS-F59071]|nr:hypothetical protein BC937DRAFT_89101 [Endogone sp. FLAS-F59071]|eukprot:RUS18147.1 hypothetical protein BC937DRAFT_89101 [Endogone sp. FLAS-F59071]